MPKISIVIPIYKVEKTLERCVDSVIAQTLSDFEVILVNDGSPDRCGEICDAYQARYPFVSVIHQENGGLSAARNAGLDKASGEYVMFLDSDDHLEPECLELIYYPQADMSIGSIINEYDDGREEFQPSRQNELISYEQYSQRIPELFTERRLNYVHAKLYRRQIILDHGLRFEDDMLTSAEDTVFNFTFLKYCRSVYICENHVHRYVVVSGGLGSKFYIDRYDRFRRLHDFIADICAEIGCLTPAMQEELDRRLVRGAVWTLMGINMHTEIAYRIRKNALEGMYNDEYLRKITPTAKVEHKEDLTDLMQNGSKRYLLKKRIKLFYSNILDPP